MKKLISRWRASRRQSTVETSAANTSDGSIARHPLPGVPFCASGDTLMGGKEYNVEVASAPSNPDLSMSTSASPPGAVGDANTVTKLKSNCWSAWLQKGEALLRMGQLQAAEEALQKALELAEIIDKPKVQKRLDDLQSQHEVGSLLCDNEPAAHATLPDDSSDHKSTLDHNTLMAKLLPSDPDLDTLAQAHYTWNIADWKAMQKRELGPVFECGRWPWRIICFPSGNNVDNISLYLSHAYEEGQEPSDWYACVQFAIVLWDPQAPSQYIARDAHHRFTVDEPDWGFTDFCRNEDKDNCLKRCGAMSITVYLRLVKDPTGVLWHNFYKYDSKKETGMVGLTRRGTLCYLNTTLQSLYNITAFRKVIYNIPSETGTPSDFVSELQALFRSLETSDSAVSTMGLTASFGWHGREFIPEDICEFWRVLMMSLQRRLQGTSVQRSLSDLFVGKSCTYLLRGGDLGHKLSEEEFWHLDLKIRDNSTLQCSFDEITAPSPGSNSSNSGTIRVRKFETLPPVLCLQLQRAALDTNQKRVVKLYDSFEFGLEFDATRYIWPGATTSEPWLYQLIGVIVHDGDALTGKHYCFLRPGKEEPFYRFENEQVNRATIKEAVNANFGCGSLRSQSQGEKPSAATAVMLLYLRKSRLNDLFMQ
ncbi:hypothetical protein BDV23DRAFT_189140 [Aspergillus alliaceus]|uniref:Uncharacterized protein n=1 Tax=Petromyces alliaceus TaxID=209559 RepID=A0A5N7BRR1_PETAA|nr:hypothetical protein BDV23DRAFT_189140 [Aspergillus alliaceus]